MVGYVAASYIAEFVCGLTGAEHTLMANAQAIVIGLLLCKRPVPLLRAFTAGWPASYSA